MKPKHYYVETKFYRFIHLSYHSEYIQECYDVVSFDIFAGKIPEDWNVQKGVPCFPFCNGDDFPQLLLDR